jgi:hypothetical protein
MFSDKNRPLYKSAYIHQLKEIPKGDFLPYIQSKFEATKKKCPSSVAEKIYDTVRGYPYYVQKLSSLSWDMTSQNCTLETVADAYAALLELEETDFSGIWNGLTLIQKSVLRAISKESVVKPFSREFLERHRLSLGGTQRAIQVLLSKDLIEKGSNASYRITDPIFSAWAAID